MSTKSHGWYFTVIIPYTDKNRTEWHPTEKTGPFKTLCRGAFKTKQKAHDWARAHLGPNPVYRVEKKYSGTLQGRNAGKELRRIVKGLRPRNYGATGGGL